MITYYNIAISLLIFGWLWWFFGFDCDKDLKEKVKKYGIQTNWTNDEQRRVDQYVHEFIITSTLLIFFSLLLIEHNKILKSYTIF